MFKHVLVTLDGTPRSESVIAHAMDLASAMRSEVTLLRVVDPPNQDWGERGAVGKQPTVPSKSLLVDQAQAYLERVAAQFRGRAIDVHTSLKHGHPAKQIVTTAKEVDADAIAMATHSRRGLNRLMFGSVAEAVLQETSLPILLIRSG